MTKNDIDQSVRLIGGILVITFILSLIPFVWTFSIFWIKMLLTQGILIALMALMHLAGKEKQTDEKS